MPIPEVASRRIWFVALRHFCGVNTINGVIILGCQLHSGHPESPSIRIPFRKSILESIFNNFTEQEKALFACFHEPCCIVPFRSYIDQDQILHTAQENTAARGAFKSRKSEASYIDAMPSNNYLKTATFWS